MKTYIQVPRVGQQARQVNQPREELCKRDGQPASTLENGKLQEGKVGRKQMETRPEELRERHLMHQEALLLVAFPFLVSGQFCF